MPKYNYTIKSPSRLPAAIASPASHPIGGLAALAAPLLVNANLRAAMRQADLEIEKPSFQKRIAKAMPTSKAMTTFKVPQLDKTVATKATQTSKVMPTLIVGQPDKTVVAKAKQTTFPYSGYSGVLVIIRIAECQGEGVVYRKFLDAQVAASGVNPADALRKAKFLISDFGVIQVSPPKGWKVREVKKWVTPEGTYTVVDP